MNLNRESAADFGEQVWRGAVPMSDAKGRMLQAEGRGSIARGVHVYPAPSSGELLFSLGDVADAGSKLLRNSFRAGPQAGSPLPSA